MIFETFFWDYHIFSFLIIALLGLYLATKNYSQKKHNLNFRRKTLLIATGAFFIIFFSVIFYGSFVAPRLVVTRQVDISINKTTKIENIKIVHLTDLHLGPYKKSGFLKDIIKKIEKIDPDIVVITGDFIYNKEKDAKYFNDINILTEHYPTYAITGNHEFDQSLPSDPVVDLSGTLKQVLTKNHVDLIDNQSRLIQINDAQFNLAGIQDIWTQPDTINQILQNLHAKNQPNILLAHNPEIILEENSKLFDLILSGHTHGGQIRLPIIGSLSELPTKLGRNFDYGVFTLENKNFLEISKGLGESGVRARFFCRPEIVIINLDL